MVNGSQERAGEQAIDVLLRNLSDADREKILTDLVNEGGISLDHESLRISGTYAHAARVAAALEAITAKIPTLLQTAWEVNAKQQQERDLAIVEALKGLQAEGRAKNAEVAKIVDEATKKLVKQSATASRDAPGYLMFAAIGLAVGVISTSLVCFFLLFPLQLRQARLGDGEILEWLSTDSGQLLYRTFRSGNRSVRDCAKKVVKSKDGRNKIVCQIELQ